MNWKLLWKIITLQHYDGDLNYVGLEDERNN